MKTIHFWESKIKQTIMWMTTTRTNRKYYLHIHTGLLSWAFLKASTLFYINKYYDICYNARYYELYSTDKTALLFSSLMRRVDKHLINIFKLFSLATVNYCKIFEVRKQIQKLIKSGLTKRTVGVYLYVGFFTVELDIYWKEWLVKCTRLKV